MNKEIAELKAENARLKEEMCSNCDFQKQYFVKTKNLLDENKKLRNKICKERAELKAENEALIEGLGVANKYVNKYHQTLQEIKAIAEEDCEFCDDIGGCMNNECRKVRILDLITNEESEG